MHYYIDGYNLMFRISHSKNGWSTNRQQMIEDLNEKIEALDLSVTIVFDAHFQSGDSTRSHFRHLEVLFTDEGQTADDRILEELRTYKRPTSVVVVTSDKKLAWFARRCSAQTESIEIFVTWLNKRYKNRLRQKKEVSAIVQAAKAEINRSIPSKPKIPVKTATVEECTDYYLEKFQASLQKADENKPSKPKKQVETTSKHQKMLRKSQEPKLTQEEKDLLDSLRWLKIFEQL